ncbi:MAG: BamA/TamA family outer membrane protein [Deltaproteobacteria bacterium]|nr:BamA/TamA family outer membrane protein [Deltaproteobacteria bacterium]
MAILKYMLLLLSLLSLLSAEESAAKTAAPLIPEKAISISGIEAVETADVYDAVGVDYPSFFQFWKDDRDLKIKIKLIPSVEASLRAFYDAEGYYDANFTLTDLPDMLKIRISEGEPVLVGDINISSNEDISEIVLFEKGEIFKAKKFIEIKSRIIEKMLQEGYCSYRLDTKAYVDLEKHTADVVYELDKGGVCTFGKVTVKGLETIDEQIVKSRVRAAEGKRFSTELVQETSTAIYRLQSFDSVLIGVDRKFYNVVPVDIQVKEMADPYHIEAGAGYDTYVGPRIHANFVKHNFLGNAQQLRIRTLWSSLEQLAIVDFYKPVLFTLYGYDIDLGITTGYSDLEFDGFRETKTFGKTFLKYESGDFRLITGFTLEAIEISELDDGVELLPSYAYDNFLLAYPYVDVRLDRRDSKLNPKFGYYLSAYSEIGLPTDSESSLYMKTVLEARGIYTVSDLTMAVVGKIGAIDILDESAHGIPESKKFFGGGAYSNRAYGYRELGVVVSPTKDLINGALSMANVSFELDYPIMGDLYGAVFTDNTILTDQSYNYTGDIISSAGVGIRYITPVGPFKLDVGFNTHDPSIYGISFQIGQSF